MIEKHWKRIAAIHCQEEGTIGVVWLAHDREADVVHLYDCAVFRREVLAVIAEGLNARGRWIPIAWEGSEKPTMEKLLDRGCNMLPDPVDDTKNVAEVISRDIWERMRTGRFKVNKRLAEWLDEYKSYYRDGSTVPRETHPLMAATRHAVNSLDWARKLQARSKTQRNYPKVAIV